MLQHQICNIFFPRKCELFINRRYISRFAVVPLCFDHSMDFKIPQAHLVVSLIEPPFFSNTLGDLDCNTPVCTAMAVFLVIAQPAVRILCRIILLFEVNSWYTILRCLGMSRMSDFLSRSCFFVYVLSAMQIAPITNRFPFDFIRLAAVRGPFMSCWCPVFVGIKSNLSFHILKNDLPLFLCLFLLHRCVQFFRKTRLGTRHFTS